MFHSIGPVFCSVDGAIGLFQHILDGPPKVEVWANRSDKKPEPLRV